MIAIERRGRLGNQLFQFAFGIAASRALQTSFVMADGDLRRLFTLGDFGRLPGRARRSLRYRLEHLGGRYDVLKVDNTDYEKPADVMSRLADQTLYAGFFQSESFFRDARDAVRAAYAPRPIHVAALEQRYGPLLETPYICCHVRRTDYLQWGDGMALPPSYYADALESLGTSDATVVFVGDDLDEVRSEFGHLSTVRFEQNSEIVDLLLMKHAAAVVSSNSSFGWWGAWLGSDERPVVAPRYWLGFREKREFPPEVIPERWRQVTVSEVPRADGSPLQSA